MTTKAELAIARVRSALTPQEPAAREGETPEQYAARLARWRQAPAGRLHEAVGERVYPVWITRDEDVWPCIVFARATGQSVDTLRGAAYQQGFTVDVIGDDYDLNVAVLEWALDALRRADVLYLDPEPPVDGWDIDLRKFRSQIFIVAKDQ